MVLLRYYCAIVYTIDYSAAHVLWIAQNAGVSSGDYQEVGSSLFELEHTNTGTHKLFVLVA